MVASIFAAHGFACGATGKINAHGYSDFENVAVKEWVYSRKPEIGYTSGEFCKFTPGVERVIPTNGCVKMGVEYWPIFRRLGLKLFTVRRDPLSIARSLSNKQGRPECADECLPLINRRNELLDQARAEGHGDDLQADEIAAGNFSSLTAGFAHHGLVFHADRAARCVDPTKWHKW